MSTVRDDALQDAGIELEDARLKRDWGLLFGLTFLFSFGFSVYGGVFQNYLRDVMHASPLNL